MALTSHESTMAKLDTEIIGTRLRDMLEREKHDLRLMRRRMSQLSRLMGDFSLEKKSSWPGLIERVLGVIVDGSGLFDDAAAYMASNNRIMIAEDIPIAMHYFGIDRETNVVFERGEIRAMHYQTPSGLDFWALHYGTSSEWDLYAMEDQDPAQIFSYLSRSLWKGRRAIRLDLRKANTYGPGEVLLTTLELDDFRYIGALSQCVEEWRSFREAGIRRSVLLQGKPGSGKSTLCLHAASELTQRCALLAAAVYEEFQGAEWKNLLKLLNPEMLILDDVDRVGSAILGAKLSSFEERRGVDDLPFVLFTSNDITQIPDAFRRPGRIDQILLVEEPSSAIRRHMVERFAVRIGVDVPEEHMPRLEKMVSTHSGAHVIEALKRARVLGWDHLSRREDITFKLDGDTKEEE